VETLRVVLVALAAISAIAGPPPPPCGEVEHRQVAKEADTLRSWDDLHKSYRRYRHCEDIEAAEGYSESIARILADHWETLPRLKQLVDQDRAFGDFVRLDATMDMKDVAKIRGFARNRCPTGFNALCLKLEKQADETIAENRSLNRNPH
jgi:hypothetical protein